MAKRKGISKKTRFEVFKRDGFACQYCGAHPPKVILHVDHIVPVAAGGGNEDGNLITACDGCNLGKGATPLTSVPESLAEKAASMKEREEQLRGYSALMAAVRERLDDESWQVAKIFMAHFGTDSILKAYRSSIKTFIEKIGVHQCIRAMERAVVKRPNSEGLSFRYFCGICWAIVREESL